MSPTQRKRHAKRGRPKVAKSRLADGKRLGEALALFRWSQREVAARTLINTFTLSQIISGNRDLGREDLRALAKIGIPPDYILGVTDRLIPPGQTRTLKELEDEVAFFVAHNMAAEIRKAGASFPFLGMAPPKVDGAGVLSAAVLESKNDYLKWADIKTRVYKAHAPMLDLFHLVDDLYQRARDKSPALDAEVTRRRESAGQQLNRLYEIVNAATSKFESRFLQFPESNPPTIEDHDVKA